MLASRAPSAEARGAISGNIENIINEIKRMDLAEVFGAQLEDPLTRKILFPKPDFFHKRNYPYLMLITHPKHAI